MAISLTCRYLEVLIIHRKPSLFFFTTLVINLRDHYNLQFYEPTKKLFKEHCGILIKDAFLVFKSQLICLSGLWPRKRCCVYS